MSKQHEAASTSRREQTGRLWRLTCFSFLPFLLAFSVAMAVTAFGETHGTTQATGIPLAANGRATLAQLMNLAPVPERPAPGFVLTDQHGKRLSLASFRGKAVLLGFFDSRCTEVCPVVAAELIAAEHDLGARARHFAFVGVNVNPLAESVAAVQRFSVVHGLSSLPNWYFLTGSTSALGRVWTAYGISVVLPPHATQTTHADFLYFVNPLGRERFLAAPGVDQRRNGIGYLPADTVKAWGKGIAMYLEQAASG